MIPMLLAPLLGVAIKHLPDLFSKDKPLTQTAIETVVSTITEVTGQTDAAKADKVLKENPDLLKEVEKRITKQMELEFSNLQTTQETMRVEQANADAYVRRARPTFLYIVGFSIAVEVLIALYAIIFEPSQINSLATVYSALATPQGIAAAMCGVYMKKRSDEKLGNSTNLFSRLIK